MNDYFTLPVPVVSFSVYAADIVTVICPNNWKALFNT